MPPKDEIGKDGAREGLNTINKSLDQLEEALNEKKAGKKGGKQDLIDYTIGAARGKGTFLGSLPVVWGHRFGDWYVLLEEIDKLLEDIREELVKAKVLKKEPDRKSIKEKIRKIEEKKKKLRKMLGE